MTDHVTPKRCKHFSLSLCLTQLWFFAVDSQWGTELLFTALFVNNCKPIATFLLEWCLLDDHNVWFYFLIFSCYSIWLVYNPLMLCLWCYLISSLYFKSQDAAFSNYYRTVGFCLQQTMWWVDFVNICWWNDDSFLVLFFWVCGSGFDLRLRIETWIGQDYVWLVMVRLRHNKGLKINVSQCKVLMGVCLSLLWCKPWFSQISQFSKLWLSDLCPLQEKPLSFLPSSVPSIITYCKNRIRLSRRGL